MPASLTYLDHQERGQLISDRFGLDIEALGGKANAWEEFSYLNCHTGSHMDAPWHYDDISEGRPAPTIDQVPLDWCFGDGVWIDLSWKKPGKDIHAGDIESAFKDITYKLKPMDIVLIKTGACDHYGQAGCDTMHAGITREATLWLADQGIRLVGIDAGCWDRPPSMQLSDLEKGKGRGSYMQGHRAAGERGMCIIEWITNLDQLPHVGFSVYAFPIKVERGSAGWVRAVAFVKEEP